MVWFSSSYNSSFVCRKILSNLLLLLVIQDELVWGAAWLYKASNDQIYWNFVKSNIQSLGPLTEFGWDSKHAGINVLISQVSVISYY